jgi:hypothetical protein
LTFVVAATCSNGKYDNPNELSTAEQLITMEQGGAIADVSAARMVTNPQNVSLIRTLYSSLFKRNLNGIFPRLGDAWQDAKSKHLYDFSGNCQKFHLFGDPTLRLLIPQNVALVDSIYVDGIWTMTSDSVKIKSLGRVQVAGTVKQRDTTMTLFNGKSTLQLFDSQKEVVIQEGIGTFRFKVSGSPLYRGEVSITNGHYISTIPIPKDVTFGGSARISIYTWNDQTDGVGFAENVIINGVDTTAAIDTVGPRIEVYLNDFSFHAGDIVKSNPTLIVRLEDESGINTSTVGVGHQLFATISNPERTFDLSGYYHSDLDKYQSGEVRYPLLDLSDGKYMLRVKAWDIQNNSSEAETFFEVYSADDFALLHVFNYPNPFSSSTTFTFQRNTTDPIDIEVKIYSIAGRYIQNIQMQSIKDSFVKIPWDGKDNDGSEIANGVYFYKVIIQSQDGIRTRETIGKCALIR